MYMSFMWWLRYVVYPIKCAHSFVYFVVFMVRIMSPTFSVFIWPTYPWSSGVTDRIVVHMVWSTRESLQWRHNGRDGVSNHQPHDCLLNRLFRRKSTKTSKLRVTGLCAENSPWTGEFSAQMASNAENVSISWRHHVIWVKRSLQNHIEIPGAVSIRKTVLPGMAIPM